MDKNVPELNNLDEALHYLGSQTGGYKNLCCAICPEHKNDPDEAQKKVARKLAKKPKEVFSDADMDVAIAWGHKHGCHVLRWWKDDLQSYERSTPKHKKSELVTQYELCAELDTLRAENQARIEELEAAADEARSRADFEVVK